MLLKIAVIAAIIYLDQLTKWLIITYLPESGLPVINGVLRFTYVENRCRLRMLLNTAGFSSQYLRLPFRE